MKRFSFCFLTLLVCGLLKPGHVIGQDLIFQNPAIDVTSLAQGEAFTITGDVLNQGNSTAGSHYLGVYISSDQTIDFKDDYFGIFVNALDSGASESINTGYTLPFDYEAVDYYVIFRADDRMEVAEENETNNDTAPIGLTVIESDFDLVASGSSVQQDTVTVGTFADISAVITNQGSTTSEEVSARVVLSMDNEYDDDDMVLYYDLFINNLAPGDSSITVLSTYFNYDVPGGDAFIIVFADYDNTSDSEADETNNVTAIPLHIDSDIDFEMLDVGSVPSDITQLTVPKFGFSF